MRFAGLIVVGAFVFGACGADADDSDVPDEAQARAAVERFAGAWERGDGAEACSVLRPRDARGFNVPCARYFSQTSGAFRGLRVKGATVSGDEGVVEVDWLRRRRGQDIRVLRIDDEWLVAFGQPNPDRPLLPLGGVPYREREPTT